MERNTGSRRPIETPCTVPDKMALTGSLTLESVLKKKKGAGEGHAVFMTDQLLAATYTYS